MQYNRENFFSNTFAKFRQTCYVPEREPDYISESGSRYWYENGKVFRQSDHWGVVASCLWVLMRAIQVLPPYKPTGVCEFSLFFARGGEQEQEYHNKKLKTEHPFVYSWKKRISKTDLKKLDDAQARAKVRTTTILNDYYDIERSLNGKPKLALVDLDGCLVTVSQCTHSDFPSSYKWVPEGTVCTYVFKSGRPVLRDVRRGCTAYGIAWVFTNLVKELLITRMEQS